MFISIAGILSIEAAAFFKATPGNIYRFFFGEKLIPENAKKHYK
jgi:hypothetical protein